MRQRLSHLEQRAQPYLRVVLGGVADRALGLPERQLGRIRGLRERVSEGGHEECVGLLAERERGGLAGAADNASGRRREGL